MSSNSPASFKRWDFDAKVAGVRSSTDRSTDTVQGTTLVQDLINRHFVPRVNQQVASKHQIATLLLRRWGLRRLFIQSSPRIYSFIAPTSNAPSASIAWSPVDWPLIKHIPKSVRASCATHLATLPHKAVSQPHIADNWISWLNLVYTKTWRQKAQSDIMY